MARTGSSFFVKGLMLLVSVLVIATAFQQQSAQKKVTKEGFLSAPEWMGILGAIFTIVGVSAVGIVWQVKRDTAPGPSVNTGY